MNILIAEDEEISRMLLKRILQPYGAVDTTPNGQEAYDTFVNKHGENQPYDLVCLDIMMPVRDGLSTLTAIRTFEKEKGIPLRHRVKVVMTTALGDKDHVLAAIHGRCDAYFLKPYNRTEILAKLRQLGLDM